MSQPLPTAGRESVPEHTLAMRLVLECAEGCTALARPIELTLVGAQLELIPEEPT